MKWKLAQLARRLPIFSRLQEKLDKINKLEVLEQSLEERERSLEKLERSLKKREGHVALLYESITSQSIPSNGQTSADYESWRHPYLTQNNIRRFREYSEAVLDFAQKYSHLHRGSLNCAFTVNMAQNMYKFAVIAQNHGVNASVFPHPFDTTAIARPEWEEYDGEWGDVFDGPGFLKANPDIKTRVPVYDIPMDGVAMLEACALFSRDERKPLLRQMAEAQGLRHETFLRYSGFYTYFNWAKALLDYDVLCAASTPFAAYFSGRPYCVISVGGDLIFDCGRSDDWGKVLTLSFNAARFMAISNPHTLGHCRRLGFSNGIYLPYPFDDSKYSPGEGKARKEWKAQYGGEVFVLSTSRLDKEWKGQGSDLLGALMKAATAAPQLRFVFLLWGNDAQEFHERVNASGMKDRFIILPPVGKIRLIDYYRSCDIVMDHFVYGYYGATFLEASSVGKPVVTKLRMNHYSPLYAGDVAPAINASSPNEITDALIALASDPVKRGQIGKKSREWLVRNHGEEKTGPLMLALLRLTADRVPLPERLINPLLDKETEEEEEYHRSCLIEPA